MAAGSVTEVHIVFEQQVREPAGPGLIAGVYGPGDRLAALEHASGRGFWVERWTTRPPGPQADAGSEHTPTRTVRCVRCGLDHGVFTDAAAALNARENMPDAG